MNLALPGQIARGLDFGNRGNLTISGTAFEPVDVPLPPLHVGDQALVISGSTTGGALSDRLIVCGGMAAPEQELTGPGAAQELDAYVRALFASLGDRRRFVFASSCNTSPRTPYENLVAFRDACWKYGGL